MLETPGELYKRKSGWIPGNTRIKMGHFNVLRLDPFTGRSAGPVPDMRVS